MSTLIVGLRAIAIMYARQHGGLVESLCPSVSPRAARQAWGASQPERIPEHAFAPRLNWMGGPALVFRDFCDICDKHRDHVIHSKARP